MQKRYGDWVQTYTGRRFYVLDPQPAEIFIEDIGASLGKLCRFNGHSTIFYCPTPEQRVLTAELEWKPAGDLRVGEPLVGFDENPFELGSCNKRRRRFRPSAVTALVPVRRRVIRLELSDGSTIRSAKEHPWLVATKMSRNQKWLTAQEIAMDTKEGRKRYMHKFVSPWGFFESQEAGWLAGIFDGEGSFSIKDRKGSQLSIGQLPGFVLERIVRDLTDFGFKYGTSLGGTNHDVSNFQIKGGWRESLRLLGSVRPIRLLEGFKAALAEGNFNKQLDGEDEPLQVVRAYTEKYSECTGIETSTHTYLCEGFGAHNSVAQHSYLGSYVVEEQTKNLLLTLAFHLHDSGETYLGDMTRPLKSMPELEPYRAADDKLNRTIEKRFSLEPGMLDDPIIREVDTRMLFTEKRDLLAELQWNYSVKPYDFKIKPWDWKTAQRMYLQRYYELCLRLDGCPKALTNVLKVTRLLRGANMFFSSREY